MGRCTTLANKMQNTKLILCLLGAALGFPEVSRDNLCLHHERHHNRLRRRGILLDLQHCEQRGKSITLVWKSSYYCSTSTPAWAVTAAKNRQAFPSTVSCPATSAFAIDAKGFAGWVIAVIIISIFVVCCCPLIIFCICCGGIACCIGGAASQSA